MFTVKQICKLSGITPRTLHYYDEIGLLKPSRIGDNGYRYYEEEALLSLQQILFYRELGMPLENIKKIMGRQDFDLLYALENHKTELQQRIKQMERLISTVDLTIDHLKGKKEMSQNQFFEGFSDEQQAEYEQEAMKMYDPEIVKSASKKWKHYRLEEKQRIGDEGNAIYQAFIEAMPKGPSSIEARECVKRWRQHMVYFWTPNDKQILGIVNGYNDDPRFKTTFDKMDPGLAAFIRDAVKGTLR